MSARKNNKTYSNLVDAALTRGLNGAALGAFLTGKKKSTLIAKLLGAAIAAAIQAQKEARENNVPYIIEENGFLYKIHPDGTQKRIRKVKKPSYKITKPKFYFD